MSDDSDHEVMRLVELELASDEPYTTRGVADRVIEQLRTERPALLEKWLHLQAEHILWDRICRRDRSLRASAKIWSERRAFATAAAQHEAGDSSGLGRWLNVPFAVAEGRRKRLADLTADELQAVADGYDRRARQNRMMAVFLRAVADKVGDGRVCDVLSDEQLGLMWRSLGLPQPPA